MSKQTYMMVMALILLLLAPLAHSDTLYYHHDAMGSVVATTDASGTVVWSDDYQGYGNTVSGTDPEETSAGFTGQLHSHGGRYYYGARWYDPHIGRFLEIDPAGIRPNDVFSVNRYAYVNNNPYKYVDPDGRVPVPLILWAGKELLGAVIEYNTGFPASSKGFIKAGTKLVPLGAKKAGDVTKKVDSKRFSSEKQALVDMAKQDKKNGGITSGDMKAYKDLNKELPDPFPTNKVRGPEVHPNRPHGKEPHGHVGPVNHIPVKD